MSLFVLIFLAVMAAANYYVYRRLFRKLLPAHHGYAALVPGALMFGEVVFVLDNALGIFPDSPFLYMVNSAFLGLIFILFVVATVYDLVITISRRVPLAGERRRRVKIVFDALTVLAAAAYITYGLYGGLSAPRLQRIELSVEGFPFDAFRLVQLTDIHVGRTLRRDFVQALVERTNALQPDLVVITGDLFDEPAARIRGDLEPLAGINAPTYFVPGNHEYFHGLEAALATLRELGVRPLLNASARIDGAGGSLDLVGITDPTGRRFGRLPPDVAQAYAETDPSRPAIVLAHQPKTIEELAGRRCDLMLSGHTHGGQIFPFGFLVMLDQPFLAGLHRLDNGQRIFVSRGTGYWGPPLRVLAPSEISLLEIRPTGS